MPNLSDVAVEQVIKNPSRLVKDFFKNEKGEPLMLMKYQKEIVNMIVRRNPRRNMVWAATRAGKSLAMAIGIIIFALLYKGERIRIIAPTHAHTKIIMGYVIQHVFDNPSLLVELKEKRRGMTLHRLKRELSQNRIVFNNGSEVMVLSADLAKKGRSLSGFGGTALFIDECEEIPYDIIAERAMRMLGDAPNSTVFLISNPVARGYMYENRNNPKWHTMRITGDDCVKEGRLTQEFLDERRAELSPIGFKIWYDAEYPDEFVDSLIPWKGIEASLRETYTHTEATSVTLGVDVARYGSDFTVMTVLEQQGDLYVVRDIEFHHKESTMVTAGRVIEKDKSWHFDKIMVDDGGLGGGVTDRLEELEFGSRLVPVISAERAEDNKRFGNKLAEDYFHLRSLFEKNLMVIPKQQNRDRLIDELTRMRYEHGSSGLIRIIKPEKSPDFADSLNYATVRRKGVIFDWGGLTVEGGTEPEKVRCPTCRKFVYDAKLGDDKKYFCPGCRLRFKPGDI